MSTVGPPGLGMGLGRAVFGRRFVALLRMAGSRPDGWRKGHDVLGLLAAGAGSQGGHGTQRDGWGRCTRERERREGEKSVAAVAGLGQHGEARLGVSWAPSGP